MSIGEKGELIVQQWAMDVGITPNPVTHDKTGWDIILEFPEELKLDKQGLDLAPKPIQCWIQVKTTQRTNPSWQIKVTNLKRLIDTPLPAFYLIIKLDKKGKVEKAFIYHVGKVIIDKTLKKLRKFDKNKSKSLNKVKLTLPKSCREELESPDGQGMKKVIKDAVGPSLDQYLNKKKKIRNESGYKKIKTKIDFTFEVPKDYTGSPAEYLLDVELGLIPSIDIKKFVEKDIRYDSPVEVNRGKGGKLKVNQKKVKNCELIIRTEDYRKEIKFNTKIIAPNVTRKILKESEVKFLVKDEYLNLLIKPNKNQIDITYNIPSFDKEVMLGSLLGVARFINFFSELYEPEDKVLLEVEIDSEKFLGGYLDVNKVPVEEGFAQIAELILSTFQIIKHFNLNLDNSFKLEQLVAQISGLNLLAKVIDSKYFKLNAEFILINPDEIDKIDKCVALFPIKLSLREKKLLAVIGMRGNAEILDEDAKKLRLTTSNLSIEDYQIWKSDQKMPRDTDEIIIRLREKYDKPNITVISYG